MKFNVQIELDGCPGVDATVRLPDSNEAFCFDADDDWIPEAVELERGNAQCFDDAEDALDKCLQEIKRQFLKQWTAAGGTTGETP